MRLIIPLVCSSLFFACTTQTSQVQVSSPDGTLTVTIEDLDGRLTYSVAAGSTIVLETSALGLETNDSNSFEKLHMAGAEAILPVRESYTLVHGKRIENVYEANERIIHTLNENNQSMDIRFRVSNDGVAFQYQLNESTEPVKINREVTNFRFPDSTLAWLQPMSVAKTGFEQTNPSYEENYQMEVPIGSENPTGAGWVYPALFKVSDTWVLITETGLGPDYCGTRLRWDSTENAYRVGFPDNREWIFDGPVNPAFNTPWSSPWRVLAIGSLKTIIESNLGTALAEPAVQAPSSLSKPGLASWSWAILKDASITYDIQKEFIDYASDMQWSYCLVDVNWDTTIGYERIEELSSYAQSKDVGLILWYNSAGKWNTTPYHPRDKLLTAESRASEFSRLNEMGIQGIKVDFFGGDGQSVIGYYHDIMQDAAAHGLLLNFHGATIPRGWHRTYPNLMTMESVKGFEFITFAQENADRAPSHCAVLPFTRNAFDPMDFTPMNLTEIPNITRRTTPGFELALPTLFLSGIQHIAETPDGMSRVPDYVKDYLRDIPVAWDETRFVDGYPGKFVIVARRKGGKWFLTGINASKSKINTNLNLSFIENKSGFMITDADSGGLVQTPINLLSGSYAISIEPNGGFIMKFD